MSLIGPRVYIHGRIRGLTQRRVGQLLTAAGASVTRRAASANTIVLAHGSAGVTLSDTGELRLGFQPKANARIVSECSFRSQLRISPDPGKADHTYPGDQVASHAALTAVQVSSLSLYDVLKPVDGDYSYKDLVVARAVGRLYSSGAKFHKIVVAALALEERGNSLSDVRLAEAPWGELLQEIGGIFAELDGQLLLPIEGGDLDADEAFAHAESSELEGDMQAARRWYELAARLDEKDAVIPFNLGNVLDALGHPREAEIAYRQALGRSPDLADAWFNLGVLKAKAGREDEALSDYRQAFAVEPTYSDALHNAALLLMRKRRFEEALPLWEKIAATSSAGEAKRLAHLCRLELKHRAEGP